MRDRSQIGNNRGGWIGKMARNRKQYLRRQKVKVYQGPRGGKFFIQKGKKVYLSRRRTY